MAAAYFFGNDPPNETPRCTQIDKSFSEPQPVPETITQPFIVLPVMDL
jgi:hypothetical protein